MKNVQWNKPSTLLGRSVLKGLRQVIKIMIKFIKREKGERDFLNTIEYI